MAKHIITVIWTSLTDGVNNGCLDSRMYYEDGSKIMGLNSCGEPYHLGQISSSIGWALHDITEHFREELKKLFPDGYKFAFKYEGTDEQENAILETLRPILEPIIEDSNKDGEKEENE